MHRPSPRYQPEDVVIPGLTEHDIAAQLPPDTTVISASGQMDNHRKPIVSINGKDISEHDERLGSA